MRYLNGQIDNNMSEFPCEFGCADQFFDKNGKIPYIKHIKDVHNIGTEGVFGVQPIGLRLAKTIADGTYERGARGH